MKMAATGERRSERSTGLGGIAGNSDIEVDRKVLSDIAIHDDAAFAELVKRYQQSVNTNCRYMSGSPTDAEDLAQDVFVKAFFGLKRFEGRSSFETWVKRIKANHCINFLKKRSGKSFVDVEDPGVSTSDRVRVEPTGHRSPRGKPGCGDRARRPG